jgi:MFS family permease
MVEKTLARALLPIFLIIVVDILGMTIILPLLPFYAEHLGASPATVGLLVSIFAVCQLIGGPLLGRISDQVGRKPILILSQMGTLIGFGILAWANALWLVFLSRIIDGFTAGNISIAQAHIADVTEAEHRTKSFAVIGIAFGIGFLIGPALSGLLVHYGYEYPIYVAMGLSATSILITMLLLPSHSVRPRDESDSRRLTILQWGIYAEYFRRPGLAVLLCQFFAFVFAFSTFMSGFALFAERRFFWGGKPFTAREVGFVYAYVGFLGIVFQGGLIGPLLRKFGDWKLVRYGFLFATVGFIVLGWTFGLPMLLGIAVVIAFSTGALRPALTSLITQIAARSEQGSILGLTQSLQAVAQIVAPFLSGILIDQGWLAGWACMAAAASAVGFAIHSRAGVDASRHPEPARAQR